MKRFVNFFTCIIVVILFLGMSISNIFAFSSGPPDGRTGSPADGGNTCNATGCHNDFTLNSGSLAFSITAPANYTPGTASNVTVSFNNSSSGLLGFELMALDASNTPAGTLTPSGPDTQVSGNYIKHTKAGHSHGANASWTFQWTPSAGQTGTVTFYAAGNEADGGGTPANDHIYTATKSALEPGATPVAIPDITANRSTIGPDDNLKINVSLSTAGASSLADTGPADFWVWATIPGGFTFYLDSTLNFVFSATPIPAFQGTLPDFSNVNILDMTGGFPLGDYVFNFSVDDNMDGVKDDTFTDSVSVTVRELSFSQDIVPLFNAAAGTGAWFPYGDPDIVNGSPATPCGACHAGDDGVAPEECPPECHLIDFNTHAGWLAGADGGTEPLLGESSVGATDYNWGESGLRKRLRNNRMPPGMPFNIDEANRDGGDIILNAAADANDIALPGSQFSVSVDGTTPGPGEVTYGGANHAVGLLSAYVDGLNGTPTTYAGSAGPVVFADVAGLFNTANVWYNGGLNCTACHYCATEPPCFHEINFNTEAGILAGADGGSEPLLGEAVAGTGPFNWGESGLRARLRNNRMPPNSPFDVHELTRNGRRITHPITGAQVDAVDLIGEWVGAGAKDN